MKYTNIEQSKKLSGILPIKTADLVYNRLSKNDEFNLDILRLPIQLDNFSVREGYQLPCWSLSALLELLDLDYKIEKTQLDQSGYFTYRVSFKEFDFQTSECADIIEALIEVFFYLVSVDS